MKTIFSSLIAILLFGSVAMGFTNAVKRSKTIVIQAIEANATPGLITRSAEIISKRLKSFSAEKFEVAVIPGKNQIRVTLPDESDLPLIENLLLQKGVVAFYEVYSPEQFTEQFSESKKLLPMLNPVPGGHSHVIIGCKPLAELDKVNAWLKTSGMNQKIKFAWDQSTASAEASLYALKSAGTQSPFPKGSDIEIVNYAKDQGADSYSIGMTFKKSAAGLWFEATKRCMNNAIAIIIDNNVISAPTVKSEISSGICQITGDFTEAQAKGLAALVNNGELPVGFVILN